MKQAGFLLLLMIPFFSHGQFAKGDKEFSTTIGFSISSYEYQVGVFNTTTGVHTYEDQKQSINSIFSQNRVGIFISESVSLGINFNYGLTENKVEKTYNECTSLSHSYRVGLYTRKYFELGRFYPFAEISSSYFKSIRIKNNDETVNDKISESFDSSISFGSLFKLTERTSLEARFNPFLNYSITNSQDNDNKSSDLNMRLNVSNISLGARFLF
ncbi:MAG: outer membrane autotransporter protein [Flammeovirgaceae bacterium]|jgi:outer membrane autotransporter protein